MNVCNAILTSLIHYNGYWHFHCWLFCWYGLIPIVKMWMHRIEFEVEHFITILTVHFYTFSSDLSIVTVLTYCMSKLKKNSVHIFSLDQYHNEWKWPKPFYWAGMHAMIYCLIPFFYLIHIICDFFYVQHSYIPIHCFVVLWFGDNFLWCFSITSTHPLCVRCFWLWLKCFVHGKKTT